nr:hypothetical protein [uncultured Oscillibacter sp.]
MGDEFQAWVDAVCGEVRFRPDRKAIEKELRIHYEDHCKALERLDYEPELAAERSLRAMGDAQEVGRALDRVHKPWLGWLWEASRWLARGLAVLALVTLLRPVGWESLAERTQGELAWEAPPAGAESVELEHGTLWAAPGDVTERDGHTVAEIRLWLQMRDPLGTGGSAYMRNWMFSYRDEQGELPVQRRDPLTMELTPSRYWQNKDSGSGGWTRYRQTVELVLDSPPRWAEISYPLSGGDWALRVEWGAES